MTAKSRRRKFEKRKKAQAKAQAKQEQTGKESK